MLATPFLALLLAATAAPPVQTMPVEPPVAADALLLDARAAFEDGEYEKALPLLSRAIEMLSARPSADEPSRAAVVAAYEMRARTQFALGSRDLARQDFEALLKIAPAHTLPSISPAVERLYAEVKLGLVGELALRVDPEDAEVLIDGAPIAPGTVSVVLLAGPHTVTARRPNYRPASGQVIVPAGSIVPHELRLERLFASVRVVTVPPDVEVLVNGESRGRTSPGTPLPEQVSWAHERSVPVDQVSAPLVLDQLSPGVRYELQFQRECYAPVQIPIQPQRAADLRLDPVQLEETIGFVRVTANAEGGTVYLDGRARGTAPIELKEVCEGRHLLEVRTAVGRDVRRLEVKRGDRLEVRTVVRPAFAIVIANAEDDGQELARALEVAVGDAPALMAFAPLPADVEQAFRNEQLSPAALAFDENGPAGPEAARVSKLSRAQMTERLCRALGDVQGLVTLTALSGRRRVAVAWLACGSAVPDVFIVDAEQSAELLSVVSALDLPFEPFRRSLGLLVIDVEDQPGPVVAAVEDGGPAVGLAEPGDVLVSLDGRAIGGVAELERLVSQRGAGPATIELHNRSGQARSVQIAPQGRPRILGLPDRTLRANSLVAKLRFLAASSRNPTEQAVWRLNLAIALMKVEAWSDALATLKQVGWADGPGISAGTVSYLMGLCHEALGQRADAQLAWQRAAASPALLTEDGPAVARLAQEKLDPAR